MGRACSINGEKMNAYRRLVGKPEGKRLLGRPGCTWVDNIKMDLREIGWDWIELVHDRDEWRALVQLAVSQEGLSYMELCYKNMF
jgi:hypothetical protein